MERRTDLDLLRGLFIAWMTLNHTPTAIRLYTDQPLGFVSAAEGFIFLSAYLLGLLARWRSPPADAARFRSMLLRRARHLYLVHLGMLAWVFVIAGVLLPHHEAFANFVRPLLADAPAALLSAALLLYQPPLFDILPLYVAFLLLTPLLLLGARRWGWRTVMLCSALCWLAGQFPVQATIAESLRGSFSAFQPGSFDPLAWQFLWASGIALGHSGSARPFSARSRRNVILFCLPVALLFFALRHPWLPPHFDLWRVDWRPDKWHLGPIRLFNFYVLAALLFCLGPRLRPLLSPLRPLALLGRSALPVFTTHICLSVLVVGSIEALELPEASRLSLLAAELCLLFGLAATLDSRRRGPIRASPAPAVSYTETSG